MKTPSPPARIFFADTRFEKKARRPGGIPREQAVAAAQAELKELKGDFDEWIAQELGELTGLIRRGIAGEEVSNWVDTAADQVRALGDVGTTMDFRLLTFVANSLHEVLEAIQGGAELYVPLISCHVDALQLAHLKSYRNLRPDQVPELTNGLRQIAESASITPSDTPV